MTAVTSAQVRDAWQAAVWAHPDVLAITPRIFLFDIAPDGQGQVAQLYHQTRVNFFTCVVRRATEVLAFRQARYTVQVQVAYYLQQTDVPGTTFNTVVDRLEAVDALVLSQLGVTWAGTVDVYQGGSPSDVTETLVDGKQCWTGRMTYTAVKTV